MFKKTLKHYPSEYRHHSRYEYDSYDRPACLVLYAKPADRMEAKGIDIVQFGTGYNLVRLEQIVQANMPDFKIMSWHE